MFFMFLKRAYIFRNREWFSAEVKFHSFINDGSMVQLPQLDALQNETDTERKRELIRSAAASVMSHWESVTIQNIGDGHTFQFGDTGKVLYQSDQIPNMIDWVMLVIEDDQDIRGLAGDINQILPDEEADSLASNIMTVLGVAASPQTAAAVFIAKKIVNSVTYFLGKNKDDQLGIVDQSFVRPLHYPDGSRHGEAIADLSGNMYYDYQLAGF